MAPATTNVKPPRTSSPHTDHSRDMCPTATEAAAPERETRSLCQGKAVGVSEVSSETSAWTLQLMSACGGTVRLLHGFSDLLLSISMYIDCMIWYREKHREILILSIILEKICFSHQPQGGTVQPSYTTRLQSPHVKELYEAFLWLWMDVKAVNLWSIDYFRTLTFLFLSFFYFGTLADFVPSLSISSPWSQNLFVFITHVCTICHLHTAIRPVNDKKKSHFWGISRFSQVF